MLRFCWRISFFQACAPLIADWTSASLASGAVRRKPVFRLPAAIHTQVPRYQNGLRAKRNILRERGGFMRFFHRFLRVAGTEDAV